MSRTVSLPASRSSKAGSRIRSLRGGWIPARLAGGLVLAAWATMFWWLLATGRVNLYLSTNTSWVVPVGAVLLTAAAIGRLASARGSESEPIGRLGLEEDDLLAGRHAVLVVLRRHHVDE
jgi:hypothetical protein